jgi:phosphotransacetylase
MKSFDELTAKLLSHPQKKRLGAVHAQDEHTIEAVSLAAKDGIIEPVLFGSRAVITELWTRLAPSVPLPEIIDCDSKEKSVELALNAIKRGELHSLMKGKIETGELMKAVVNTETGIKKNEVLSHFGLMESPYYHKLFAISDAALLIKPDLAQKKGVILNAVQTFHALGVPQPKVALLCAFEKINPKMQETLEAAALKEMNQKGEITGCVIEGPISYDLAMDADAAGIKGFQSPVAGDADLLIVPELVSGNVLAKSLSYTGGAKACGVIVGAQAPIVLTSRSATSVDKYMSIVLAALVGGA